MKLSYLHLITSILTISLYFLSIHASGAYQCLDDQKSALMQFKLESSFPSSSKLTAWDPGYDCCSWKGITCDDVTGHVIGLDLANDGFTGLIDSKSSLFKLHTLQRLDLSGNNIALPPLFSDHATVETSSNSSSSTLPDQILPPSFAQLLNLTHLDLTGTGFSGQIPLEMSQLTSLVSLNLSGNSLKLENPNLTMFIQHMSSLRELRFNGVDMSSGNSDWSTMALSSAVTQLRVLSLAGCSISGPILSTLSNLNLSDINLSANNLSSEAPEFLVDFSSLISIDLSYTGLHGEFPKDFFTLPNLKEIDLSFNPNLLGSLPEFPEQCAIQELSLSSTSFYGKLPVSIGNLKSLTSLSLDNCNFSGTIPNSIGMLENLVWLDLSSNHFSSSTPSLVLPNGRELFKLQYLSLQNNTLGGQVHHSFFTLPSLKLLKLGQNQFRGLPSEFPKMVSPSLTALDLSQNDLQGPIPRQIFELINLEELNLSFNNLSGSVEMDMFSNLNKLSYLDLSDNAWSVVASPTLTFPELWKLELRSCRLKEVPTFVRNLRKLDYLDLSNNKIEGQVPSWIWMSSLTTLNLSHSSLSGLGGPLRDTSSLKLTYLDLHSNNLQGPVPLLSQYAAFLDYSDNNFTSFISEDIALYLSNATFFSVSGNRLVGEIPKSICRSDRLEVLDLSNNAFNGTIPSCLGNFSGTLSVLNLGGNRFQGTMPKTYAGTIRSIIFNGNQLKETIPGSLSACKLLEVLDLGNNQLQGTFPFWVEDLPNLRVLILRSNRLHGSLVPPRNTKSAFPMLHVVDLSSNRFAGQLPSEYFIKWKAMASPEEGKGQVKYLGNNYYHDSVTISIKGRDMLLTKILTIFAAIDLSNNEFEGNVPESIGELKSLLVLNLSHNGLDGHILASLGNLHELESLDLSENKLSGDIPWQLTSLTFLSVLNLGHNKLEGVIPQGEQFETFPAASYEGNQGLCGFPLPRKCPGSDEGLLPNEQHEGLGEGSEFNWKFILMGYGSGMVAGLSIGYILFWRKHGRFATVNRQRKRRLEPGIRWNRART